jgi:hypothetical protein
LDALALLLDPLDHALQRELLLSVVVVLLLLLLEALQAVALVTAHILSSRELAPGSILAFGRVGFFAFGRISFFTLSGGSFLFLSISFGQRPAKDLDPNVTGNNKSKPDIKNG